MSDKASGNKTAAKDTGGTAKDKPSESKPSGDSSENKSSKDSVGGASAVHYGYFSNVRSDDYRDGWDDIWKKKSPAKSKPKANAARRKR